MDEVKDSGPAAAMDEDISTLVARLSRKHRSGGRVIERAAIMAEGGNSVAILAWLADNNWEPEADAAPSSDRDGMGLPGLRRAPARGRAQAQAPRRYISPAPADEL